LDALGNWSTFTNDGVPQPRTHNRQNQVTAVGTTNLTFDNNGNTTTDDTGHTFTYDAWNRLMAATSASGTVNFTYDALNRRLMEAMAGGATTDLYYSAAWQVLEERIGGTPKAQYVWSPVYVDALVERDRDANGQSSDGLEERLYAQQDANYNITALVDAAGNVALRIVYDPYGGFTLLTPTWGTPGSTQYAWVYLYQGGRYEMVSALYHFRNRDLSATLGRWVQRDPIEYRSRTINLYSYLANNPLIAVDPQGLAGQVVSRVGSDTIGVDLGIINVSIPVYYFVNLNIGGGIQGLFNCKTDEFALYWYVSFIGFNFGTPGVSTSLTAVFAWNVRNAAAYTGLFLNVTPVAVTLPFGLGFTIQGFTDNPLNPFKGIYGFEVGVQGGTPGINVLGFNAQWFGLLPGWPVVLPANHKIPATFCVPPPAKPGQPNLGACAGRLNKDYLERVFAEFLAQAKTSEAQIRKGAEQVARDLAMQRAKQAPLFEQPLYDAALRNWSPTTTIKWGSSFGERVSL
jgi:RHS repeat-associated protein